MIISTESKTQFVKNKVHKEFREFRNNCSQRGLQYVFDNALKVTFYKEIKIYVLNAKIPSSYYEQMYEMDNILDSLWEKYKANVLDSNRVGDHYLEQLLDISNKNQIRIQHRD